MSFAIGYDEIDRRFSHHPPRDRATIAAHEAARSLSKAYAKAMLDLLPPGREASLFATAAGDALMYANQAIAIGGLREGRTITDVEEIRQDFGIGYGVQVDHTSTSSG